MKKAILVLKDGTAITGNGIGACKTIRGEVVFNTSMTGYQEALTDPSYNGQILTWCYPLCGNYGINKEDFESDGIKVEGFLVREACEGPEHWQMKETLDKFLSEQGIPGMSGFDTRELVKKIRVHGVIEGVLCVYKGKKPDRKKLLEMANFAYGEEDLALEVSTKRPKVYGEGKTHVVVLDCGFKMNIVRCLVERGAKVTVVPGDYDFEKIMKLKPDGILVSNGPGDPEKAVYAIETVKKLVDKKIPLFGICLGHQIIALACGGKTYKLKFGHRGSNQPVKEIKTERTFITAQNHGYAVDEDVPKSLEVTHFNLNDKSVEGIKHRRAPAWSVQWHPEASPGPKDTEFIFDEFLEGVNAKKK